MRKVVELLIHLSVFSSCLSASRAIGGSVKFTRLNGQEVIFTDSLTDPKSEAYRNLENLCNKIVSSRVFRVEPLSCDYCDLTK